MAWTADDLVRSLRRYLNPVLNDPSTPTWTIRSEVREVGDDERPVAVIEVGPTNVSRARTSLWQGEVVEVYPVTISAYPALGADERASRHEADGLRDLLGRWISLGYEVFSSSNRLFAGPFRIPLWDYADIGISGSAREVPDPFDPIDVGFVEVASLNVVPVRDPDDYRRFSVIANFRVSIERPGREPQDHATGAAFSGTFHLPS